MSGYTTEVLDARTKPEEAVRYAAGLLQRGEPVAFPTETVYGLGACVFDKEAVRKVFLAKGRPSDNPLIVHLAAPDDCTRVAVNIPPLYHVLAERFFPGPLTIVLDKHPDVPSEVTAGLSGVAVRVPAHPVALALIREVGQPLVAPSANRSGRPSPTTARHVVEDLDGRIAAVLDGGACSVGIESTVVSIRQGQRIILRPGAVTLEHLREATGEQFQQGTYTAVPGEAPQAPGMKYRHYAPQARVVIAETAGEARASVAAAQGRVRVLAAREIGVEVERRPLTAQTLYAEFRSADADGIAELVLLCDAEVRENAGLMNRIRKAAEG